MTTSTATTVDYSAEVIAALKDTKVDRIVHVPDSVLAPILVMAEADSSFKLVSVTREEEAIGIMAGFYVAGERAILMMQSTGLGNSLNALGSLTIQSRMACPMLISLRGELGDRNFAQVPWGRVVPEAIHLMSIQSVTITDVSTVRHDLSETIDSSYRWNYPTAAVLTRAATGGVND